MIVVCPIENGGLCRITEGQIQCITKNLIKESLSVPLELGNNQKWLCIVYICTSKEETDKNPTLAERQNKRLMQQNHEYDNQHSQFNSILFIQHQFTAVTSWLCKVKTLKYQKKIPTIIQPQWPSTFYQEETSSRTRLG